MGDAYIATIKLVEAVGMHLAHSRIKDQPILTKWFRFRNIVSTGWRISQLNISLYYALIIRTG